MIRKIFVTKSDIFIEDDYNKLITEFKRLLHHRYEAGQLTSGLMPYSMMWPTSTPPVSSASTTLDASSLKIAKETKPIVKNLTLLEKLNSIVAHGRKTT